MVSCLADIENGIEVGCLSAGCHPGYAPEGRKHLEENAKRLDIPLEIFDTDVLRVAGVHSAEHPCFLCAKMRRGYLYTEARKRGCNKIALGHHYDDAIGTVLMGLIYGGQVQAMLPRVKAKVEFCFCLPHIVLIDCRFDDKKHLSKTPVVQPSNLSMVTVKGVPCIEVL